MVAIWNARDFGRAWLAGYGQILFCEFPLSGLFLFLGFTLIAPLAGLAGAVGGGIATCVALSLSYPSAGWRAGLYGYGGVLCGLFWGLLFSPTVMTTVLLVVAAAISAPLTHLAHSVLTPRKVPALALPALCLIWLAWPFLKPAEASPPVSLEAQLIGYALLFMGLVLYSRVLTLAAVVGGGVGFALSVLLTGGIEPGLLFNAAPTAMALGAVFVPWSWASVLLAGVGAVVSGTLWWEAVSILGPLGFPVMVAPFNVVTVGFLGAVQVSVIRGWLPGKPSPLPLSRVGHPEAGRWYGLARRRLEALVGASRRICVLTGAGVSTASGLPDFRSQSDFWSDCKPVDFEQFLGSAAKRGEFWRQEERFFRLLQRVRPADTHRALVELYHQGRLSAVITQNVDGLHQAAGLPSEVVIELHGSIGEAQCVDCGHRVARASLSSRLSSGHLSLYCERCQGLLKGGGLMFGEAVEPGRLEAASRALLESDLLLVLGTSLSVAPASDILGWATEAGIPIAIVNATPTMDDEQATVTVHEDIGTVLVDLLPHIQPEPMPTMRK